MKWKMLKKSCLTFLCFLANWSTIKSVKHTIFAKTRSRRLILGIIPTRFWDFVKFKLCAIIWQPWSASDIENATHSWLALFFVAIFSQNYKNTEIYRHSSDKTFFLVFDFYLWNTGLVTGLGTPPPKKHLKLFFVV